MSDQHNINNSLPDSYFNEIIRSFIENPWFFLLRLILTICLITRGVTELLSRKSQSLPTKNSSNAGQASTIPRVPYWIPFVGHQLSFSFRNQSWLLSLARFHQPAIFTITLFPGRQYHVIASSKLVAALQRSQSTGDTRFRKLRSRRFFANRHAAEDTTKRIDAALSAYSNDTKGTERLCKALERNIYNFISPSTSWVDQTPWERNAEVSLVSSLTAKPSDLCVTASLPVLVREFTSYVILSTLLGASFLDSNPNLVEDLFTFGAKYDSFMTGWPYWIMPGLGPPAWRREKCLLTLESLVDGLVKDIQDETGGGVSVLYDLDEVHDSIRQLVRNAWQENSRTGKKTRMSRRSITRMLACEILEVVWSLTYDKANMVLWAILDIFGVKNEDLRKRVEKETKEIIHVEKPTATGLPIQEPPQLRFKINKQTYSSIIRGSCSGLTGVLLINEQLRTWPEEYLDVNEDLMLQRIEIATENEAKTKDKCFQLKKGSRLYIAHGVANREQGQWNLPGGLDRAEKIGGEETDGSNRTEDVKRMKGVGQIEHCVVSALVAMYVFEVEEGGSLEEPSSKTTIAEVDVPSSRYRAKISRRPV